MWFKTDGLWSKFVYKPSLNITWNACPGESVVPCTCDVSQALLPPHPSLYFLSFTCLLTLSNYVGCGLLTHSLTGWSCVGSGLLTNVCDFTWQHEKHKSGSKWKLVRFSLCSLPGINDAMIWVGFVAFFPSHVPLVHFLWNKMAASRRRHNLNFISPQRV